MHYLLRDWYEFVAREKNRTDRADVTRNAVRSMGDTSVGSPPPAIGRVGIFHATAEVHHRGITQTSTSRCISHRSDPCT